MPALRLYTGCSFWAPAVTAENWSPLKESRSLRKLTTAVFSRCPLVLKPVLLDLCRLEAAQETEKFNLNHWLSSPLSVHAYVVSVPTSERRARMSSRLQHHNVPFTFVDGMQPEVQSHVSSRPDAEIVWQCQSIAHSL